MNAKTPLLTSLLLALGLANSPSFAADKTWDRGGGVNDWTNAVNWDLDTAPVAGDSLFFAGSGTGNSNNFAAFTLFNGITFNSGASGFTLAGNAINLGGNIVNNSGNSQTIGLATILTNNISVNLTSTGSVNLNGAITGNQTITLNGGTSGGQGTYLGSDSRHSFQGTLLVNGFLYSRAAAGGVIVPGATVNLGTTGMLDMRDRGASIGGLSGSAGSSVRTNGGTQTLALTGSGNYNYAGVIENGTGTTQLLVGMNYGAGKGGSQTLSGNNTFTGQTILESGKLVLDYGTNNTSKLSTTQSIAVRGGGTIELAGGNFTQQINGLALFTHASAVTGQLNITRSSGDSILALGAISYGDWTTGGGGAINFAQENIATTTTGLVRGLLSTNNGAARITVGGANWATTDASSNIVAYTDYTPFVTTGGDNTKNYELSGGSTATGNLNFSTLKISSSTGSAQTLALGVRELNLTRNGLLLSGTDHYTISADAGGGLGTAVIHNYSTGTLTLGATRSNLELYGTGKTVLTAASTSTWANNSIGMRLGSGTLQFSNNNQLVGYGNLALAGGTLIADTSSGNISLTNDVVGGGRTISLGSDVPVIDVIGGGTLTIGGIIQNAFTNPAVMSNSLVYGSANSSGTIIVTGNNTYTGDTRLDGVRLSVNSNTSLGSTSANYKVVFSRNSTLNTTADITTARYYDIYSGVTGTIETDASTTLTHSGTIAGAGNLRKTGAGTLELSGTNTYSGKTTIDAGTLLVSSNGSIATSAGFVVGTHGTLDVSANGLTVGSGKFVGGDGLIEGNLTLASGALFAFNTDNTLTLGASSTFSLHSSFGVASLRDLSGNALNWDSIGVGEYTLLTGGNIGASFFNATNITNFGLGNALTGLGTEGTKSAYFDNGSLQLVVIPEPGTLVLMGLSLAALLLFRRRR